MGLLIFFIFSKVFVRNLRKLTPNQREQFFRAICFHFMVTSVSKSILGASQRRKASSRHLTNTSSWLVRAAKAVCCSGAGSWQELGSVGLVSTAACFDRAIQVDPEGSREHDLQLLWTSISFMRPHIPLSKAAAQGNSPVNALKSVCSSSKVSRNCVPVLSWQVTHKTEKA